MATGRSVEMAIWTSNSIASGLARRSDVLYNRTCICVGARNDDGQHDKGTHSKEVVEASAGEYAEATQWLREALTAQRAFLRANRDRAATRAFYAQTTVIALGFIAIARGNFFESIDRRSGPGAARTTGRSPRCNTSLISAVTALIALMTSEAHTPQFHRL